MKNSEDKNLERITDKIKQLEDKRWSVSWESLEALESQIKKYQVKLLNGEYYEPRF